MNVRRIDFCNAVLALIVLAVLIEPIAAQNLNDLPIQSADKLSAVGVRVESGAWLQASITANKPWKHVSRGSVLEGCLTMPVYSGEEIAIPSGTKLRLTPDSLAKVSDETGKWKKLRRAILRAFGSLDSRPAPEYIVHTSKVEAILPDGSFLPLKTRVLRVANSMRILPEIRGRGKEGQSQLPQRPPQRRAKPEQIALLRLDEGIVWPIAETSKILDNQQGKTASPNRARVFMLTTLSASQSHEGDVFQAQLAEPVRLAGQMFEAGSLLEGSVVRSRAPRILSRAGSLRLRVNHLTSQQGQILAVTGTLAGAEANGQTRFELDEEGGLHGLKPGLRNALVDLGMTYFLGKVTDDVSETPIRAIGAGMSDAAVASAARYIGFGTSAVFLVTRRGRDVYLPKYAEVEIEFGRFGEEPSFAAQETIDDGPWDF